MREAFSEKVELVAGEERRKHRTEVVDKAERGREASGDRKYGEQSGRCKKERGS